MASGASPKPRAWAKRRRTYWLQAPGAAPRSTTVCPAEQVQRLVDLLQLVGGAGAVALLLGELRRRGSVRWSCSHARLTLPLLS